MGEQKRSGNLSGGWKLLGEQTGERCGVQNRV